MTSIAVNTPFERDLSDVEDDITELAAHISAGTYRLLTLIREFDERRGWNDGGCKSCAHWLNWKCGIDMGAAREKVRVAHALAELPQISDAFRDGCVSYSKVRAMTRVATAENEDYLLMIANHGTASHVERLVRGYRQLNRLEALNREQQRHASRSLRWYIDDDGCYVIKAQLSPEQGVRVVQALDAAANELFIAQQFVEQQCTEQQNVSAETSSIAHIEQVESAENRRADALGRMADGYLSSARKDSTGGDRYTLHVHTDIATLRNDGNTEESGEAVLENAPNVSAETARRLACDCGVVHWLENSDGTALDIGRRSRTIPPALRRALERRDKGCKFPACTAQHHVDAHHIQHWADGGATALNNLVLLCRHHHRAVHEGGFAVAMQASGEPLFSNPQGQTLQAGPETRFCGNAFTLMQVNEHEELTINPRTALTRWRGEKMDLSMATDGLRRRDAKSRPPDISA